MKKYLKILCLFVSVSLLPITACDEKEQKDPCDPYVISDFWIDESNEVVMWRHGKRLRFWEKNGSYYVSESEFVETSNNSRISENESGDRSFQILHEDFNTIYLKNGEQIHIFTPVTCEKLRQNRNKDLMRDIRMMRGL